MKLGEAMYKAQQASGEGAPAEGAAPKDDNVVDADFEEVDDEKKKGAA
jgi:molecular chaperone DnaK